ncbi:ribonuclease P protein subunit p25b [Conger conger]|uniref:ribonuclease P protein subunit p25b n=1 Tax=Conger conger TaxID=82655 RepID=UPI002A5A2339|nr:ribonuclease P protein subunit p25b [Conger conger]
MMELSLTPDMFLPYQGQPYCGQPAASCSISNVQAPPPPPPLSSLLPAPGHIPTPAPILIPGPVPAPVPAPTPAPLKPGQGGFRKVCRTEEAGPCPFPGLPAGVLEMRVKEGSKIRNLMGFAMTRMQGGAAGDAGGTGLRQVVFTGSGRAVTKTITCAEIMKRKVGGLHQLTKLCYRSVREVWESLEGGAPDMTMHRTVPSISILLSKDQLDPGEPGYQPPETLGALWEPPAQGQREGGGAPPTTNKRPLSPAPYSSQPECKRPCRSDGGFSAPFPK